jgi:putrescine---pyruvate transaminase
MEREDLLGQAARVGSYFETRLALEALPLVGQVRGRKLMLCVENVADKVTKRVCRTRRTNPNASRTRPRRWG